MHAMTVATAVLHRSTLVFLAAAGLCGLARAQQAPLQEGGATVEISVPLMDAGSAVLWAYRPFSYQSVSLFASLDSTNISVATRHSLNTADPPRYSTLVDFVGESLFPSFPQVSITDPPPNALGVILDESVSVATLADFIIGLPPNLGLFLPFGQPQILAQAHGFFPPTIPASGSGRWHGQVLGIDIGQDETRGNQILGDVAILLEDFTDPHVDVQFSGLLDVATGNDHPVIQRRGIPVEHGFFEVADADGVVRGRFFGPASEEVGGAFAIESILGAFGATRIHDTPLPDSDGTNLGYPRLWIAPTKDLASFSVSFDVGVRFRLGGASTSRVGLDYSAADSTRTLDGQARLSTVWLEDGQGYVYRDSFQRDDTLDYTSLSSVLFGPSDQARVYSGGLAANMNPPTGGATWIGAVAAMDPLDRATTVRGDALVRIDDFADPVAFVALTNLREDASGRPRHDIYWNRVPVRRGAFHGKTAGGWIRGRFHGPTGDGVAGTFFRPALTGAFGASRSPPQTGRSTTDGSVPTVRAAPTAFQVIGRVSGSAVPFESRPRPVHGEAGEVAFSIAEHAYRVVALGTPLPTFEWVEETRSASLHWLGTILGGELTGFEELLDGDTSYTLRPLPNGGFGVLRYDRTGSEDTRLTLTAGFAFGAAQRSNPVSGAATWTGEALGFDITDGETSGNQIGGIATLTIGDFADPMVDVAFTGLQDMQTRTAIADMTWSAVPLERGEFRSEGQSGMIDGQMYGTDHSHVGGVFERDGIVGGFGARRGPAP